MPAVRYELIDHPEDATREAVLSLLREFNLARNPAFFEDRDRPENAPRPLHVFAYDDEEGAAPVGGLLGQTVLAWLKIDILAVRADLRARGIGTALMAAAEAEGRARGCRYAYLDTMSFQAAPFYEKLGYALAGRLPDWDSHGHDKLLFTKSLV